MPYFPDAQGFTFGDSSFVDVARDLHVHITTPTDERRNILPRSPLRLPQLEPTLEENNVTPESLESIMDKVVRDSPYSVLNWRESIVDLCKALGVDHSLSSRRKVAVLMGYGVSAEDTYKMNVWLHRKVLAMLKESGGGVQRVTQFLRDVINKNEEGCWVVL